MTPPVTQQQPTAAGVYDFLLGGTAHGPADRAAGEQLLQLVPEAADAVSANRGFVLRAVKRMATDWGIRQFLDLGAGLLTQRNVHDVVADVAPDGRVVYVDIDPVVVAHGAELLAGVDAAGMVAGDLRNPAAVLGHPEVRRALDLTQPVGLVMGSVLHLISDDDDPWALVRHYLAAVPAGSYLALSHGCGDGVNERMRQKVMGIFAQGMLPVVERTKTEIERFFTDLELVPPYQGAEPVTCFAGLWGAEDPQEADTDGSRLYYVAVARKP